MSTLIAFLRARLRTVAMWLWAVLDQVTRPYIPRRRHEQLLASMRAECESLARAAVEARRRQTRAVADAWRTSRDNARLWYANEALQAELVDALAELRRAHASNLPALPTPDPLSGPLPDGWTPALHLVHPAVGPSHVDSVMHGAEWVSLLVGGEQCTRELAAVQHGPPLLAIDGERG